MLGVKVIFKDMETLVGQRILQTAWNISYSMVSEGLNEKSEKWSGNFMIECICCLFVKFNAVFV